MCGISAIIGKNVSQQLINSLKQLQNRGYDSAGLTTIEDIENNKEFLINKYASTYDKSAIEELEQHVYEHRINSIGIAHTRWATHGAKTDINSHPHKSNKNKFVIVHNGIIENYIIIKNKLINEGYNFISQTDTEVIVNLLEYNYIFELKDTKDDLKNIVFKSIHQTISMLEGTWGISIMCLDTPNILYCIRQGSPLLVSCTTDFGMIVSEQSGFCNYVQNYIVLENNDICYFERDNTTNKITMDMLSGVDYKSRPINIQLKELTPNPYPHWMLKEIYEQKETTLRAISLGGRLMSDGYIKLGGLEHYKKELQNINNIIILGCGTSYYAGMLGVYYFKELSNFNTVQIFDGSEFSVEDIPLIGKTALIFISQSGETRDLYRCIELGKKEDCFLIGVVNVPDSMIAREVHCGCYLNAGREVAVASTKSFTSQSIILSMLAMWFGQIHNKNKIYKHKMYIKDLRRLYLDIERTLLIAKNIINDDICNLFSHTSCFILGKGKGEAIALEGALKIKEISYIHSEGYSASSLKHGPFALLCKGFPVILIDIYGQYNAKMKNIYEEIKSRNATIIVISDRPLEYVEHNIVIPKNNSYSELLSVIILQFLSYKLSIIRGINPDMPRNLAKVVTVE